MRTILEKGFRNYSSFENGKISKKNKREKNTQSVVAWKESDLSKEKTLTHRERKRERGKVSQRLLEKWVKFVAADRWVCLYYWLQFLSNSSQVGLLKSLFNFKIIELYIPFFCASIFLYHALIYICILYSKRNYFSLFNCSVSFFYNSIEILFEVAFWVRFRSLISNVWFLIKLERKKVPNLFLFFVLFDIIK